MTNITPQMIIDEYNKIWSSEQIVVHCSAHATDEQIRASLFQLPDALHDQPFTVKRYGFKYKPEIIEPTKLMKTRGINILNKKNK